MTSRFNNTGGAYGTPHCDPLRLVLVGGMGSRRQPLPPALGLRELGPVARSADSVVYACFNQPEKIASALVEERHLVVEPQHRDAMDAH